jgi:hypothetical protein
MPRPTDKNAPRRPLRTEGGNTQMQDYRHSWTSSTTNARTGIFEAEGGERNGRLAQLTKPPRPTDKNAPR